MHRADVDGREAQCLFEGFAANAIALDLDDGKIYWTTGTSICRANLDGSLIEQLIDTPGIGRIGLALDQAASEMYSTTGQALSYRAWMDLSRWLGRGPANALGTGVMNGSVQRVKMGRHSIASGTSDIKALAVTDFGWLGDIALDIADGRVYWTSIGALHGKQDGLYEVRIQRAKLDGGDIEDLIYGIRVWQVNGIALDLTPTRAAAWRACLRPAWLVGASGLLAILGLILIPRYRIRHTQPSGRPRAHEHDDETGRHAKAGKSG
ncbi:MAG TPA: hypothetical protein VMV94_07655, partial [Phycisphaerae bacterium]|nr:hypothetical protein [Phycisphaerae bacterium]